MDTQRVTFELDKPYPKQVGKVQSHKAFFNRTLELCGNTKPRGMIAKTESSLSLSPFLRMHFHRAVRNLALPFIGISGIRKIPLGKTNYNAAFAGESFCMNTLTSNSSQGLASPRCGIRIYTKSFNFTISYKGEFNKYTKDHQIDGRLEWTF